MSKPKQPRLITLIGYPAAGKSTYGAQLREQGFTFISGDDVIRAVMVREGLSSMNECYSLHSKEINATLDAQLAAALMREENIVFDAMNTSVKRRSRHLDMVKQHGNYYCKAAIIHPPEQDEHAARLIGRLIKGEQDRAVDGLFQAKIEAEYEAPTKAEGYDKIYGVGVPPKQPLLRM